MAQYIFGAFSILTCAIWIGTQMTWLRWLGKANGNRPFIRLTLSVGWVMTVFCAFLLGSTLLDPPHTKIHYVAEVSYRFIALAVCFLMWQLHDQLHDLMRRHED